MAAALLSNPEFGDGDSLDAELALASQIGLESVMGLVDADFTSVGGGSRLELPGHITSGLLYFTVENPQDI